MVKSVIIIGAGLAGLATGCFAQMNGYKTKILEKQAKSGGVCVSWMRKGYTFDYAVHNVFGVAPHSADSDLWRQLGAFRGLETHRFKEFSQVEDTNGKAFTVYTNLDELERHMMKLSPNDKNRISEFVGACRRFTGYDVFGGMSGGFGGMIRMLPILRLLMKYSKVTLEDYSKGFTDPFLQKAFSVIQYDVPIVPVIVPMLFLAEMSKGDGIWPMGGSLALSKNVERRYLELGGQIVFRSRVVKILVDNDKAVGVQLEDGSQHFADVIISAADGHSTIFEMLEGKYVNDLIRTYYNSYPETGYFGLAVWYGVKRDLCGEPHALVLFQDKPLTVEGREYDRLDVEIFNFDPSLAPPGKNVVKVVMASNYDYWRKMSEDIKAYKEEKKRIADIIAERLDRRFPGFKSQIEAVDVVTPISVEHFTASYRGNLPWPAPKEIAREISKKGVGKTLPGLEGFHMVGQWAGAIYSTTQACLMGRDVVQQLCKGDRKEFVTVTSN